MNSESQTMTSSIIKEDHKSCNGFLYALGFFCLLNIASGKFEKHSQQEVSVSKVYAIQIQD